MKAILFFLFLSLYSYSQNGIDENIVWLSSKTLDSLSSENNLNFQKPISRIHKEEYIMNNKASIFAVFKRKNRNVKNILDINENDNELFLNFSNLSLHENNLIENDSIHIIHAQKYDPRIENLKLKLNGYNVKSNSGYYIYELILFDELVSEMNYNKILTYFTIKYGDVTKHKIFVDGKNDTILDLNRYKGFSYEVGLSIDEANYSFKTKSTNLFHKDLKLEFKKKLDSSSYRYVIISSTDEKITSFNKINDSVMTSEKTWLIKTKKDHNEPLTRLTLNKNKFKNIKDVNLSNLHLVYKNNSTNETEFRNIIHRDTSDKDHIYFNLDSTLDSLSYFKLRSNNNINFNNNFQVFCSDTLKIFDLEGFVFNDNNSLNLEILDNSGKVLFDRNIKEISDTLSFNLESNENLKLIKLTDKYKNTVTKKINNIENDFNEIINGDLSFLSSISFSNFKKKYPDLIINVIKPTGELIYDAHKISFTNEGEYSFDIIIGNKCSKRFLINISKSFDDYNDSFLITPNPSFAGENVNVRFIYDYKADFNISIYHDSRLLRKYNFKNTNEIDFNHVFTYSGNYLIRLSNSNLSLSKKIIIK